MSTSDSTQIFLNGTDQLAASGQSGSGAAMNSQGALLNPRGSTYGEFFVHSPFGSRGAYEGRTTGDGEDVG